MVGASFFVTMYYFQPRRLAKSNMPKQNFCQFANVISDGSLSRICRVRRISLGITTRPRSSIHRTMPVAFIPFPPALFLSGFPQLREKACAGIRFRIFRFSMRAVRFGSGAGPGRRRKAASVSAPKASAACVSSVLSANRGCAANCAVRLYRTAKCVFRGGETLPKSAEARCGISKKPPPIEGCPERAPFHQQYRRGRSPGCSGCRGPNDTGRPSLRGRF